MNATVLGLLVWCTTALALVADVARAQVPAADAVEHALSTSLAATQARPALLHDGPVAQRVKAVLLKQADFVAQSLHPWADDNSALLLTTGNSDEHGIRPNAHAALAFAAIYRCTGDADARDRAIGLLRYLLQTHGAAGRRCADGKPWHNQWQSALWATSAGQAAWLLWDELDPTLKWLAGRMICDEADRFVDLPPPHQVERDTKAEENAWNSQVIALAFNMFPRHPHHAAWRAAAIRWQLSSFATACDVASDEVVDGRPLRQWLTGANLHDDYTLENHDRVHPDYMCTTRINLYQSLMYDWGGNPAPKAIFFNTQHVYASVKQLTFPDGGFVYPNGQDWQLHRNADWFDLHAAMAVLFDDPQAARFMRLCLETTEKMLARDGRGGIYAPGETRFPSSQTMLMELYADAYLLLRARGEGPQPVEEARLWQDLSGPHVFDAGKFAIVRTDHSVATFSWGRQVMGMVLPLQKDLLLTPNDRGLVGSLHIQGIRERPVVRQIKLNDIPGGFGICGELERGQGDPIDRKRPVKSEVRIEQRFGFLALPDGRVVYVDWLTPQRDPGLQSTKRPPAEVIGADLATLGVLNDRNWVYHDGSRTLYVGGQPHVFTADSKEPLTFQSLDANLDDVLGIVFPRNGGRHVYEPVPTGAAGRVEQLFHLNRTSSDQLYDQTGPPAQTAIVIYPGQRYADTQRCAESCELQPVDPDHPGLFDWRLDKATRIVFDLQQLTIKLTP